MKNGFRSLIPLALAILIVSLILVVALNREPTPIYTVNTFSVCLSESHDIEIGTEGNSKEIIAPMKTPNPCYSVVGDVKFSGKNIEVDISAVTKQQECIQCIGEVTGRVVIQDLTKGAYDIKVKTPDKATSTTIMIE